MEFHHFQAIAFNHEIWVVAAMTGNYPHEAPLPNILIFNPKTKTWRDGAKIPVERLRGSAGIFARGNSVYIVSGIKDGHWDGHVTWFDEYDTKKDKWTILPDAPHARDHFQAALVNDQLYLGGGRRSNAAAGKVLDYTVKEVDYYDFKTNKWSTVLDGLPTPRAGTASVGVGNYLIVMNGESVVQKNAHAEVEALDTRTGKWTTLTPMNRGRHGTGVVYLDSKLYVAAGNETRGGGAELSDIEVLAWKPR
jgi:N-acetylneuraminic acid mutarotase